MATAPTRKIGWYGDNGHRNGNAKLTHAWTNLELDLQYWDYATDDDVRFQFPNRFEETHAYEYNWDDVECYKEMDRFGDRRVP